MKSSNGRTLALFLGLIACLGVVVGVFGRPPKPPAPEPEPTESSVAVPYEDPLEKIELVRQNGVTFLTIPVPIGSAGVGYAATLDVLPGGCVVGRPASREHDDDYDVLMWPAGTTIDSEGSIHTDFGLGRGPHTYQIGQRFDGGRGASLWSANSLGLTAEEREACPGRRYIWLDE